ncbi:MAG: M20/M25/M40 family metallo-hydrolase [Chitinophagaceae bacterium]
MRIQFLKLSVVGAMFFTCVAVSAQETVDLFVVDKIKAEGLNQSRLKDIAFHLTDANGPRLAGSEGYMKAANWAKDQLAQWGFANSALEPWGEFGKGWTLKKSYVAMTAPYYKPIIAYPKAWTKGTGGPKNADILLVEAKDTTALDQYKGKLKGKILLLYNLDTVKQSYEADSRRYTDQDLEKMAQATPEERNFDRNDTAAMRRRREMMRRRNSGPTRILALLREAGEKEGAVAILSASVRGKDGTLFVQGGGAYAKGSPENFLDIVVAVEDYNTLCRLIKAGIPVKMDVDVATEFNEKDTKGYNVVAEIKGTDPKLKDEVVMLGGHLDSWHSSTGATDNAAGCTVMMEAVRILKTIGVQPRRTIRIALWGGEEEGLIGSRNYVKNHFGDPATMKLTPEHDKFSSYFNIDNGTGKVRGIYLQGNDKVKDIFAKWLEPFRDMGASTITLSNTGGTDHQSFDAVGLPGFQFIQEPMEYSTRTHHTNMDSYDHLSFDDLKQTAVIVASFVYDAAMRDEKLPRKELPKPRGNGSMF